MDILGISPGELAWLLAALVTGGFITGILAGLLGIGGGGILVPILYELFGVIGVAEAHRMHLAVGTSLAIIIPTSFRSVQAHYKRGAVDMEVVRTLGPYVAIGVLFGILIAGFAAGSVLKMVYVASCVLMSFKLFAGGDRWHLGTVLPGNPLRAAAGTGTGIISTLIGIGGGVYVTAFMTLYGRAILQSVATASAFGPIISIPAALGYVWAGWNVTGLPPGSLGYVSLLGAAIVIPSSVLAAPLGVRIAHGISRRTLEIAFATFLALVALRFATSLYMSWSG